MNRRVPILVIAATALTLTACGSDEPSADDIAQDQIKGAVVSALDFPPAVFEGWEITDAVDGPSADDRTAALVPALVLAAGADPAAPPADATISPDSCAATHEYGDQAWHAAHGDGAWAGQIGVNRASNQTFTVDVSDEPGASLDAITRFVERCGQYSYTAAGVQVGVVTTVTESDVLRYGLNDLRMFTTTATAPSGVVYSTLTAVGTHSGRVVSAQFTAPGTIDGPVINVAGNWWSIVAKKVVAPV